MSMVANRSATRIGWLNLSISIDMNLSLMRLVRMATAAFERACYGDHAPSEAQIAEMLARLEELEQSARPTAGHPG